MDGSNNKVETIEAYISLQSEDIQGVLQEMRQCDTGRGTRSHRENQLSDADLLFERKFGTLRRAKASSRLLSYAERD